MKIKHKGWEGTLQPFLYSTNNSLSLQLMDDEDGQPIMVFTINLDFKLTPGFIAIKDYSENEGSVRTLVEHGVINWPDIQITQGFVQVPLAELTEKAKDYLYPILQKRYPNKNINKIIGHYAETNHQ